MKHVQNSGFEPGTIALAAAVQPRYYEFTMSLDELIVPAGTKLIIERSCDITQNFNRCVKNATGSWVLFLGDDHSFAPDFLLNLLKRNVDVVVPITPCKVAPWMPCLMHGPDDGNEPFWRENMPLYDWDELSGEGLLALPKGDFIGQAGMLVRKSVLERIGYPWFKCGQLDAGRLQEDMMFCHELQNLGYTVWVDQDIIFDHYFVIGITARRHQGKWVPALKSGGQVMVLPDAKPTFNPNVGTGTPRRWERLPNEKTYLKSVAS